jgi:hypothetical protein
VSFVGELGVFVEVADQIKAKITLAADVNHGCIRMHVHHVRQLLLLHVHDNTAFHADVSKPGD